MGHTLPPYFWASNVPLPKGDLQGVAEIRFSSMATTFAATELKADLTMVVRYGWRQAIQRFSKESRGEIQ